MERTCSTNQNDRGWQCLQCGRVWSPAMSQCWHCNSFCDPLANKYRLPKPIYLPSEIESDRGWQCPKCGRGWSPYVPTCWHCYGLPTNVVVPCTSRDSLTSNSADIGSTATLNMQMYVAF